MEMELNHHKFISFHGRSHSTNDSNGFFELKLGTAAAGYSNGDSVDVKLSRSILQ